MPNTRYLDIQNFRFSPSFSRNRFFFTFCNIYITRFLLLFPGQQFSSAKKMPNVIFAILRRHALSIIFSFPFFYITRLFYFSFLRAPSRIIPPKFAGFSTFLLLFSFWPLVWKEIIFLNQSVCLIVSIFPDVWRVLHAIQRTGFCPCRRQQRGRPVAPDSGHQQRERDRSNPCFGGGGYVDWSDYISFRTQNLVPRSGNVATTEKNVANKAVFILIGIYPDMKNEGDFFCLKEFGFVWLIFYVAPIFFGLNIAICPPWKQSNAFAATPGPLLATLTSWCGRTLFAPADDIYEVGNPQNANVKKSQIIWCSEI